MMNPVGLPNVQPRGLGGVTAQAPVEQPGGGGGLMDTLGPLLVGAITTAALASLMTPPTAAALAPTLGAGILGTTGGAAAGGAASSLGGTLAAQGVSQQMAGTPQAPNNPNVAGIGMGPPKQLQGTQGLGGLLPSMPQQPQAQPQPQQQPQAQPQQGDSRAAAMMRGFGGLK